MKPKKCPIYNENVKPDENGKCYHCEGRIDNEGNCTTLLSRKEVLNRISSILSHDSLPDEHKIQDIREEISRIDSD